MPTTTPYGSDCLDWIDIFDLIRVGMIKLAPALAIACLTALSEIPTAYAACATDDPVAVAKTFYSDHADFSLKDPSTIRSLITPRLFAALDREYKCVSQGQVCALETDVWTDAQDGEIGKPVEFIIASHSGVAASVTMTYPFILEKTRRRKQHVTILLQRKSPADCWLISDLVGPRGESLVGFMEKWHKEFGGER